MKIEIPMAKVLEYVKDILEQDYNFRTSISTAVIEDMNGIKIDYDSLVLYFLKS